MNNSLPSYPELLKKLQKQNPNIKELLKRFKLIPLRVSLTYTNEKVNEITPPKGNTE